MAKMNYDTPALLLLGGAIVGGFYLLKDAKPAAAKEPSPDFTADNCEKILQALPEPFKSVLNSPTTDLSNPATLDYLAVQLDKAGQTKAAACLRTFKDDIVKGAGDGSAPVNCEDLIGSATYLNDAQKGAIRVAIANASASREDLQLIANTLRTFGKSMKNTEAVALANCVDAVATEKNASGLNDSFKTFFLNVFAPKSVADTSAAKKAMV